jgi:putative membrane protein
MTLIGSCALMSAAAFSQQTGNPAGMSPATPGKEMAQPSPDGANPQDQLFVRQAALGGQAEVELGKLAQKKAGNTAVREFAQHMVDAHTKSNQQLMRVSKGLNPDLPKNLDPEHVTVREQLQKANGKDFDLAYMASQIQDHQRTANLLQWHITSGQNEALKKYSMDTLPEVMDHLERAKQQFAMLTMTPPPR